MSLATKKIGAAMAIDCPRQNPGAVLAVIPCLNEENYIETCIRSLMTGDEELRSIPIVVVDGGSTDATCSIVEQLMLEFDNLGLIHNPKKLQSAALNLAVREASTSQSEWLIRCDAHSIYPPNFILDVVDTLVSTRAESVVIPMDAKGTTCMEKANAWIVDTPLGSGGSAHRGGRKSGYVDHGHHAGFLIEDFRRLGGYDETFSHNEDAEYDARLSMSGGRIFLDADIRIQYVPRGTVSGIAKQYFNYGKGRARNAKKNSSKLKLRQMLPIFALLANIAGLALWPLFLPALILPLGYLAVLGLASIYIMLRHRSLCGVLSGVALGTMHMSWAGGFITQTILQTLPTRTEKSFAFSQPIKSTIRNLGSKLLGVFSRKAVQPPAATTIPIRANKPVTRVTRIPQGECVYAVGDIHGRFDLLESIIALIREDSKSLPEGTQSTIVFLGDYIDRGLQSRQIIDYFLGDNLSEFETVFLMGNHEEALLNFVQEPSFGEKWAMYGGAETLYSYGLQPPVRNLDRASNNREQWKTLWHQFRATITAEHLEFYQSLKLSHTVGDYVFVHAGLRPGIPLEEQQAEDLLWIRDDFLAANSDFEKLVVHGHTPADTVHRDNRRIGLDTGAYMTGRLTAARFFREDVTYLTT